MRSHRPTGATLAAALLVLAGLIAAGGFVDLFGETGGTKSARAPTAEPGIVQKSYVPFLWGDKTPTPVSWEAAAQNWAVSLWEIAVHWPTPEPMPVDVPVEEAPGPVGNYNPPAKGDEAPAPPPVPAVEQPSGDYQDYDMAASVFAYVNSARAQNGLAPLSENGALMAAAQGYAQLLTDLGLFTHDAGGGLLARARGAGYGGGSLGEALWEGWGSFGADSVVTDWLNSPPHRDILLGNFSEGGAACYVTTAKGTVNTRCVLDVGSP